MQMTKEQFADAQNEPTDFAKMDAAAALEARVSENSRFAGDSKLYVQFFTRPVRDEVLTAKAKRPMFTDTEYVKIMIPGDKQNINIRPATDEDKVRFALIYEKFKKGASQNVGTPLTQVGFLTASLVEELRYFNIVTVEQLAGAPDSAAQNFLGLADLKDKAKKYLTISEDQTADAQKNTIAELQAQVKTLLSRSITPEVAPADQPPIAALKRHK
jgi:hypothetical protein